MLFRSFCGQVGDDDFGSLYANSMEGACGGHHLQMLSGEVTGKCLSLISRRDGERTMLTDLGTSVNLRDLGGFSQRIRHSKVIHFEGYYLLGGPVREAAQEAMELARHSGVAVSLDCADPFVAKTCKDELIHTFKNHVNIGF